MNGSVKITGGVSLRGTVQPIANKNSILACLPASILTSQTVIYRNVPKSTDVSKILEMLVMLGADVDQSDFNNLKITCKNITTYRVPLEMGQKIRSSILLAGPLLARFGKAEIPVPGGCKLGKRSIAAHVDVFQKAGIKVSYDDQYVKFEAPSVTELSTRYSIWQVEASVTATENLAMYAAGVNAQFTLIDAACEPHVVDLLDLLESMGAQIKGAGSNKLSIHGESSLHDTVFTPRPDFVDIAGYIVAAAITDGEIRIKDAADSSLVGGLIQWFEKFNILVAKDGNDLIAKRNGDLKIDTVNSGFPMAGDELPKLYPRPWPGFPVDVLPVMVSLALKTHGKLLMNNWMYESGLDFVRELNGLGAKIYISNPQTIIVEGPIKFKSGEVVSPDVIQACKAIFLAALADPVEITLHGVNVLKRRYPDIFEIYKKLGAKIELID